MPGTIGRSLRCHSITLLSSGVFTRKLPSSWMVNVSCNIFGADAKRSFCSCVGIALLSFNVFAISGCLSVQLFQPSSVGLGYLLGEFIKKFCIKIKRRLFLYILTIKSQYNYFLVCICIFLLIG